MTHDGGTMADGTILDTLKKLGRAILDKVVVPVAVIDDTPPTNEDGDVRPYRMHKDNYGLYVHVANAADIGAGGGGGEVSQGTGSTGAEAFWTIRVSDGTDYIPFPTALDDARLAAASVITDGTNDAAVTNAAPSSNAWGLVVRNIPSGTHVVGGNVAAGASGASEKPVIFGGTDDANNVYRVNIDSSGAVRLQSGGAPGATAPSRATQIGGVDGGGLLRALPIINSAPAGSEYGALVRTVSMPASTQGAGSGAANIVWVVRQSDGSSTFQTWQTPASTATPLSAPTVVAYVMGRLVSAGGSPSTGLPIRVDALGNVRVCGSTANGSAPTEDPVYMAGLDGSGLKRVPLMDSSGRTSVMGNRIARTSHLASATLPAAGAYTSQTPYTVPEGVIGITAYITYTRGAVGGQVVLRPQYGNGTETAYGVVITSSVASGGTSRQQLDLRELLSPIVNTASAVTFEVEFAVPPGTTLFNLLAAEVGVAGTPGTCAITLTAKYGGA